MLSPAAGPIFPTAPHLRRRLASLGVLLAILGLFRLALTVVNEPLLGYGNQFDTIRVSACVGLYPDLPEPQRYAGTPWAPIPIHVFADPRPQLCIYGSELVFAHVAVAAFRALSNKPKMNLRWVGRTKLLSCALMVSAACVLLWAFPLAGLLHGLTVFAVVGDPLVSLWFNTLYAEAPILLGAYLLIVSLVVIALAGRVALLSALLLATGVLLLGLSKMHFALLPLVLLLAAFPVLWTASRRFAVFALLLALVPGLTFFDSANDGALRANRVNTYLGALASSSREPLATLERLDLPRRCQPLVGASWYRLRGEDVGALCPEVFDLGNVAFLRLALTEPATLATALARAAAPSQNVFSGYLGFVAGHSHGRFDLVAPWNRSLWEPLFMRLPGRHYVALLAFAGCAGLLAAVAFAVAIARGDRGTPAFPMALYAMLLIATLAYTFVTTVLGDGFSDTGKHLVLGAACLAAALIAGVGWGVISWSAPRGAYPRKQTVVIAASSALVAAVLIAIYAKLPLSVGVIDRPGDEWLGAGDVNVAGWALDPYGIESVEARVGTHRFRAEHGHKRADVAIVFPGMRRADSGGFQVKVPAGMLTAETPDLKIVAINRRGIETEIDARRLAPSGKGKS